MRHGSALLFLILAACTGAGNTALSPVPSLVQPITADELRRDLVAFAHDSLAGRETGTPYANRAARFLVNRLVTLGVEPAGDSLYYQRVPLIKYTFGPETRIAVSQGQSSVPLAMGPDVAPLLTLGAEVPLPRRSAEGELAFAGYGMSPPDFQAIKDAGKVIVMIHGAPATTTDSAERVRLESSEVLGQRIGNALQFRPTAIVLLTTGGAREFYTQQLPGILRSIALAPGDVTTSDSQRPLPMIVLGLAKPGSPLLPATWPSDESSQMLTGRHFSARIEMRRESITGYNVVGIVRGSDPRMNKTYVAFGAHYDHIGFQPGMSPDSIANGADDDGSGSVTMLALAKSMTTARPRRSALFVWHIGEEKGLLGSQFFTDRPTVPIDSIIAQLNLDMIGRRGGTSERFDDAAQGTAAANRLYVVGPNAAPNNQSKVLGAILDTVNARQLKPFALDHEWDTPTHPERIYFRSDHYNYARKGIPIAFFTTGLHGDYHKVSDESSRIDYEKMARIGGLLLELGTTLGNRETRPR